MKVSRLLPPRRDNPGVDVLPAFVLMAMHGHDIHAGL
jgi:hypothetical protein